MVGRARGHRALRAASAAGRAGGVGQCRCRTCCRTRRCSLSVGAWIVWARGGATWWLVASVSLFARLAARPRDGAAAAARAAGAGTARPAGTSSGRSGPLAARAGAVCARLACRSPRPKPAPAKSSPWPTSGWRAACAWALTHPALYVWRTLAPAALTTLDVLPRIAQPDWARAGLAVAASVAAVAADRAAVVVARRRWPCGERIWPCWRRWSGCFPRDCRSPPTATPMARRWCCRRRWRWPCRRFARAPRSIALMAMLGLSIALAVSARAQLGHWRDSLTLWTRAVTLDADNDVARYNLALALVEAGRRDEAIAQFQALIALVPDHDLGRDSPGRPARRPRAAGSRRRRRRRPAGGRGRRLLARARARSGRAFEPGCNRGMALVQLGEAGRAAADLEAGGAAASTDPAVAGALAFAWSETGRAPAAIDLLAAAARPAPRRPVAGHEPRPPAAHGGAGHRAQPDGRPRDRGPGQRHDRRPRSTRAGNAGGGPRRHRSARATPLRPGTSPSPSPPSPATPPWPPTFVGGDPRPIASAGQRARARTHEGRLRGAALRSSDVVRV